MLRCLIVVALVVAAFAHPTKYPRPSLDAMNGSFPPFRSYHVHVMFQTHINTSCTGVINAFALRDQFIKQFNPDQYVCEGDFDQGRLCMFEPAFVPFGPFVASQWAAFVPLEMYNQVVPWMMQNRGNFDVFVHPNSGFEREDHHDWGMWMGQPWVLDLSDPEFSEQFYLNGTVPPYVNCNSR